MKALVFGYSFPRLAMSRIFGMLTPRAYLGRGSSFSLDEIPETVHLSRRYEYFDSSKAQRELGYTHISARQALVKAVAWYRENGYA